MNTNTNDGGPAFPCNDQNGCAFAGMTLRDWFAGQALAGMLDRTYGIPVSIIAERSYQMADAMLSARNGKGEG
jgi:hypothetical protein